MLLDGEMIGRLTAADYITILSCCKIDIFMEHRRVIIAAFMTEEEIEVTYIDDAPIEIDVEKPLRLLILFGRYGSNSHVTKYHGQAEYS